AEDGIFITESHYLASLIETLQYDTIYHEHLRYYSLGSLKYLLAMHGLDPIHARRIPTHGGSIRVYAARSGKYAVQASIASALSDEIKRLTPDQLRSFRTRVVNSKLALHALLQKIKGKDQKVYGVGAPS